MSRIFRCPDCDQVKWEGGFPYPCRCDDERESELRAQGEKKGICPPCEDTDCHACTGDPWCKCAHPLWPELGGAA